MTDPIASADPGRLSNSLADLADRLKDTNAETTAAHRAGADGALRAGRLLVEAKAACAHGEWLPFLERAGIAERSARNFMTLARSGLISATVADLGGVKAALAFLSSWRLPTYDEAMVITSADYAANPIALCWESSKERGHYHTAGFTGESITASKAPLLPLIELDGGDALSPLIYSLQGTCGIPIDEWQIEIHERRFAEAILPAYVWEERVREEDLRQFLAGVSAGNAKTESAL